jgi:hypothetical protein
MRDAPTTTDLGPYSIEGRAVGSALQLMLAGVLEDSRSRCLLILFGAWVRAISTSLAGCDARYRDAIDRRGSNLSSAVGRDPTMTGEPGAKDAPRTFGDEDRAQEQDPFRGMGEQERRASLEWVGENLTEVRRAAFGQRILYWSLGIGFMVGLAADVGGYLIKSSTTIGELR